MKTQITFYTPTLTKKDVPNNWHISEWNDFATWDCENKVCLLPKMFVD